MFTKEEALAIRKEFWIAFAEAYPRKWLLHKTKIKDFSFKFYADTKKVQVLLDIECRDEDKRKIYFEKIESLKTLLLENHLPEAIFERQHFLDTGKEISRIWVELDQVSIHKKTTWPTIFDFFHDQMSAFEIFFYEYEEYIRDLEINT